MHELADIFGTFCDRLILLEIARITRGQRLITDILLIESARGRTPFSIDRSIEGRLRFRDTRIVRVCTIALTSRGWIAFFCAGSADWSGTCAHNCISSANFKSINQLDSNVILQSDSGRLPIVFIAVKFIFRDELEIFRHISNQNLIENNISFLNSIFINIISLRRSNWNIIFCFLFVNQIKHRTSCTRRMFENKWRIEEKKSQLAQLSVINLKEYLELLSLSRFLFVVWRIPIYLTT